MTTLSPSSTTHRRAEHFTMNTRTNSSRPVVAATTSPVASRARSVSGVKSAKKIPVSSRINVVSQKPAPAPTDELPTPVQVSSVRHASTPLKSSAAPSMKRDKAVKSAMASVATMDTDKKSKKLKANHVFSWKRVLAAFAVSAIVVGAIIFLVNKSMPNLSIQVAAMQANFDVAIPQYIPRGYECTSSTSDGNKISMTFTSGDGSSFTITEEPSSWSAATLETNYVKDKFANYTTVREQGLTLFVSGSSYAWIDEGILYNIETQSETLTKKQIKTIATSIRKQ